MPKDLTVTGPSRPGLFDALRDATANAGVGIEGICAFTAMGQRTFHLLASDDRAAAVRQAVQNAGLEVKLERDVFVVSVNEGPPAIADVARRLAQADVSVEFMYLATGDRLVVGVDNIDRAGAALIGFGS